MKEKELNRRLQASIEKIFSVYLGEATSSIIYSHLEDSFHLKKKDILHEPSRFAVCLEEIFGPAVKVILNGITKELAENLNIQFKSNGFEERMKEVLTMLTEE